LFNNYPPGLKYFLLSPLKVIKISSTLQDRSKSKSTISTTSISSTTTAADSITTTTAADVSAVVVTSKTRIDSSSGLELRECPLCYDELPAGSFPDLMVKCGHRSCCSCLLEYLKIEIKESRIDISCPECKERLHPADIQQLLSNHSDYMDKYEEFMVRKVLVTDPDTRWCPAPDCGYDHIYTTHMLRMLDIVCIPLFVFSSSVGILLVVNCCLL